MWVYEEMIEGKKLTEIINETHENVKYLPGHKLPPNVVSSCVYLISIIVSICDTICAFLSHSVITLYED